MRKFTAFAAIGIAAALALTGCTAATTDAGTDTPAAVDTVNSDGSGLRAAVQAALYDHVYLAAAAIHQALQDGGDLTAPRTAAAVQALDDNSVAVSKLIGSVYPDAEQPFLDSWRSHIPFFVDYTLGKVTNDQAAVDKAVSDLGNYAVSFGELINSVVPELPAAAVQAELEMHATTLLAAIDADIAGDPSYYSLLQESASHMGMTAAALAGGIAANKGIQ
ncbi:hypothetical protein BH09ACT4_BH09ACT4_22690 [soil metagenome]